MANVSMDSFIFSGHDFLKEFGIRGIVKDPLYPKIRERKVTIPSRHGAYDFGAHYYNERTINIDCSILRPMTRHQIRECAYALSQKGYLYIWDDPDKYYVGRIYDDKVFRYLGRVGVEFTLTFTCEPFAYGVTVSGLGPAIFSYRGTAETPTRLQLTNNGTTPIQGICMTFRERI
jgi:predicted phage tail component-like protein